MSDKQPFGPHSGSHPSGSRPEDHIPPGYFSSPTPPPSFDAPLTLDGPNSFAAPQPFQHQPYQYARPVFTVTGSTKSTGPFAAIKSFFAHYATFNGRSSRAEFWWVQLFLVVLMGVANALGDMAASLIALAFLGLVVPTLALLVRRLHDANLGGGFLALALIPFVGPLLILIFMLLPSNSRGARFDRSVTVWVSGPQDPWATSPRQPR